MNIYLGHLDDGKQITADLKGVKNLLIQGSTGAGKTVFIDSIIKYLIKNYGSEELKFCIFSDYCCFLPEDIDVIINAGDAYTSYSGGKAWLDEKLQTAIRKFVYNGGGFIGVGEPTACEGNGRYFQLADVLGVDEEIGYTLSNDKYNIKKVASPLTDGLKGVDYGEEKKYLRA